MKQPFKLDFLWAGLCLVGAVYFVFRSHERSALERLRHIAVEGPIGVGKRRWRGGSRGALGAELMLEQPADNPFLDRFYDDMPGYAFQTQLFFLFQRERRCGAWRSRACSAQAVVSDFMFAKDAMFAALTLSDEEYRLYAQMHAPIAAELPRARPGDLAAGDAGDAARSASAGAASRWSRASTEADLQRLAMPMASISSANAGRRCWSSTPSSSIRSRARPISICPSSTRRLATDGEIPSLGSALSRRTSRGAVFSGIVLRWGRPFAAPNHPHHGRHLDRGLCGLASAIEFGRLCSNDGLRHRIGRQHAENNGHIGV